MSSSRYGTAQVSRQQLTASRHTTVTRLSFPTADKDGGAHIPRPSCSAMSVENFAADDLHESLHTYLLMGLNVHSNLLRLIRDGVVGGGNGGKGTYVLPPTPELATLSPPE